MHPHEFQNIILSGNLEDAEKCILDGYDTNTSYDIGCRCCPGNEDDMTHVIYMKNIDIFKLLLPLTDDMHLDWIVQTILKVVSESYTTKQCNRCGYMNWKIGASEVFTCKNCKIVCHRDVHSGRGIFIRSLSE